MNRRSRWLVLAMALLPWSAFAAQGVTEPTFSSVERITLRFEDRYRFYERAYRNGQRFDPLAVRADIPAPPTFPEQAAIQVMAAQAQGAVGAYEALLDDSARQAFRDGLAGANGAAQQASAWAKELAGRQIVLTRRIDIGQATRIVELAVLEAGTDTPIAYKRLAFSLQAKGWKHVFLDDDPVFQHFGFPGQAKVVESP
jgi:hypothetical protein